MSFIYEGRDINELEVEVIKEGIFVLMLLLIRSQSEMVIMVFNSFRLYGASSAVTEKVSQQAC